MYVHTNKIIYILLFPKIFFRLFENKSFEMKKLIALSIFSFVLIINVTAQSSFYVGTYNSENGGGIYKFTLTEDGELSNMGLLVDANNASFIEFNEDKSCLLAVNEVNENNTGFVQSYKLDDENITLVSTVKSEGGSPCYIDEKNSMVLVSNYMGGNVALYKLGENCKLSNAIYVDQHIGHTNHPRQEAPHAHSSQFTRYGIVSADLGNNTLMFSSLTDKLIVDEEYAIEMEQEAGPRHFEIHPTKDYIYVINELNSTVSLLKLIDTRFQLIESYSTVPEAYKGENYCADIHISTDGKFLYTSNRGHNSISVYKVNEPSGKLKIIQTISVYGDWPRNFSLSPDENYLIVANKKSNNIVSFNRNRETGKLSYNSEVEAFSPVCILF